LENIFPEFIFLEFTFLGIHFPKGNYFPTNKRGLGVNERFVRRGEFNEDGICSLTMPKK